MEEIKTIGGYQLPRGADGGHYTPVVTQPTADTMMVEFQPSKAGMPGVEPVEVKLPVGSGNDSGQNGDYVGVEPAEDDIPKIYIKGTPPASKVEEDVRVRIRYKSKTMDFEYPSTLKVQGHSSTAFPKKNFTWKLYKDETYESKKKVAFKNWGEMNKFVLKAHWVDHSHVRNVGAAKIFGAMVRSRSDFAELPAELRNAPNNGATDGFTCKVFVNGVYWGLYELIVPKDKLFGQDDDNPAHSILNSESNNDLCCAFATTSGVLSNWSEELQDSMTADTKASFTNLVTFVAGSTDEEFVANAETYFDVLSVIDFDIFARTIAPVDNLCKNQIFFTYDGVKWYEGGWDFDGVVGLTPSLTWTPYDTAFQEGYVAYKNHGITNMLYKRVEENFLDRFKARYWELRDDVLSAENIIEVFERLTDVITSYDGLLAEDYAATTGGGAFTGIPLKDSNNIQQIRNWIAARLVYMDEVITNMTAPVHCTGITLSASALTFNGEGTQTITATVTPDGCTDAITWESNNSSIATVNGGVVTAVANGSAVITAKCGNYNASCNVSVSGIAEAIPCTGITLSTETLSITGEGTQTLIATPTPSDTTDTIMWSSDNETIAIVENGVVTAIANGTANITVTCGAYSATCAVTVSGIERNILAGVGWNSGFLGGGGGNIGVSTADTYTDAIDISGLSKLIVSYTYASNPGANVNRVCLYDVEDISAPGWKCLGITQTTTAEQRVLEADIPEGAKYARLSFQILNVDRDVGFGGITIQETEGGEVIGRLAYP